MNTSIILPKVSQNLSNLNPLIQDDLDTIETFVKLIKRINIDYLLKNFEIGQTSNTLLLVFSQEQPLNEKDLAYIQNIIEEFNDEPIEVLYSENLKAFYAILAS